MKKIRIGVFGGGMRGRQLISTFMLLNCEIVAVCDVRPAAREKAKADFGLSDEVLFDDYKKLIDSGLCDMVDICTPNSLHCEQAKYALNAGLPVSIEKPVGVNSQEVEEVT